MRLTMQAIDVFKSIGRSRHLRLQQARQRAARLQLHEGQRRAARKRQQRLRRMILINLLQRRRVSVWCRPRAQLWWDAVVPAMTNAEFVRNFQLSRESFNYVCQSLSPVLRRTNTNFHLCLPVDKRVAAALWKLATNSEYRTVSHLFGVGIATVCHCLQDFCDAVIQVLLLKHIEAPDASKLEEYAQYFKNRGGAPQCVGAIDGSHIPIIAPPENTRDYFNRKGWHSIILQAVVDGKGQFWDVCVGFAGSVSDARVLSQSTLWDFMNDGDLLNQKPASISGRDVGYYLVGEPAYPLKTWLMKPFSDNGRLTPQQHRYNARISSARSVVEHAFGRLKGRWRCLLKRIDCDLQLVKKMVLTCCVLHNICEAHGDVFIEDVTVNLCNAQLPGRVLPEGNQLEGAGIRNALLEYFNDV